jgi:hypothetical protein
MTFVVDDDDAVIDIAQHRQHTDVGIGQPVLQAMALYGMRENRFLAVHADVIDTYICLCARAHGSDAAVFPILGCQRYGWSGIERADQFDDRLA